MATITLYNPRRTIGVHRRAECNSAVIAETDGLAYESTDLAIIPHGYLGPVGVQYRACSIRVVLHKDGSSGA